MSGAAAAAALIDRYLPLAPMPAAGSVVL